MEKPKRLLRGKKTRLKNFTEHFTKVPNCILYAKNVTTVEKLILMGLQSYSQRSNWTLAYTRMALDLHVDKSNLIDRWNRLKQRGIIIEDEDYYSINYDLLTDEVGISNPEVGSLNPPKPIDQPKDKNVGKTNQPTNTGSPTPPDSGSVCPPAKVGEPHLLGGATPAIEEENKEEDKVSKNNDAEEFLKLMEKNFPDEEDDDYQDYSSENSNENNASSIIDAEKPLTSWEIADKYFKAFQNGFKEEHLKEMASIGLMSFVKVTESFISDYDVQMSLYRLIQVNYEEKPIPIIPKNKPDIKDNNIAPTNAYDDFPWQ